MRAEIRFSNANAYKFKQKQTGEVDYSLVYEKLKKNFQSLKSPLEVDFRDMVGLVYGTDRYTHLIHTYPAKLLLNIPYFFIHCSSLVDRNSTILDPFCGSGTVLLESILMGHRTLGADANPLARLITSVKTTVLDPSKLNQMLLRILEHYEVSNTSFYPQNLINAEYWYSPRVIEQLGRLLFCVQQIKEERYRAFFSVCFSVCTRKLSLADPKIAVPVRLNPERYTSNDVRRNKVVNHLNLLDSIEVEEVFHKVAMLNINRMNELYNCSGLGTLLELSNNAMDLNRIDNNSVDFILTSPPYAGAQKYVRSSSLSIGWLGLNIDKSLRALEKENIGREHYLKEEYKRLIKVPLKSIEGLLQKIFDINPLRAHIAANYLCEMYEALKECHRVLKKDSRMILVVGNNVVCGQNFETQKYLKKICEIIGFEIELILRDNIHSRGLMTKRNKTASVIASEWIIVFKK